MTLFPRWNPHSFALITLAVYAHTHAFHDALSPEPAHLAGPSAHTRSRPTTILIHHFLPLFVAIISIASFTHLDADLNVVQFLSHHYNCCTRPHPPRTQCFLSSSSRRFCCLLTYTTNAPPCQQLYIKSQL
ncbi:hypothetical protein F5888DRAFT_371845 [Russula emetica]|nr:hypothetical protein F5888DRAFT_371845 [Russula emetica]